MSVIVKYIYTAPAFLFFEKVAGRKLYRKGQHVSRCACIRRKFIDGKHLSKLPISINTPITVATMYPVTQRYF